MKIKIIIFLILQTIVVASVFAQEDSEVSVSAEENLEVPESIEEDSAVSVPDEENSKISASTEENLNAFESTDEDSEDYVADEEDSKVFPRFEVQGRYWRPKLSGSIKFVSNNIGGEINIKDDLGIKDEGAPELNLIWHTGPNSWLRFSYSQADYSGNKRLERTIQFRGQTYTVGTDVETTFDLAYSDVDWAWQFINMFDGKVKMGNFLDVSFYRIATLGIKTLDGLVDEEVDYFVPFPTIGAVVNVRPYEWLNGYIEFTGLSVGGYGHLMNLETGLEFIPWKHFSVEGGYRYSDGGYTNDPDFVNLTFAGPYASATLKF